MLNDLDVNSSFFSPDGSRVLSWDRKDGSLFVWETASGKLIARLASPVRLLPVGFGKGGNRVIGMGIDKKLRVWDLPSGKLASEVDLGSDLFLGFGSALSVSPDGRWLLTAHVVPATRSEQVRLLDLATDKTVHRFDIAQTKIVQKKPKPLFMVRNLTFSPDMKWAAATGGGGAYVWKMPELESPGKPFVPEIVEWRTEPGPAEIRKFVGHTDFIFNLAITPDGKTAVSVSRDRTAIIWDVDTGKLRHRLSGSPDTLYAATLTPDGKRAMTGGQDYVSKEGQKDYKIRVWDTQSGELVHALAGHTSTVARVVAAKHGLIVSSAWDHTILRWDPLDGAKPKHLFKLDAPPCALAIDANGTRIAVGSPTGSVAILSEGSKAPIAWYPSLEGATSGLVWVSDTLLGVAGHSKVPALLDLKTKTAVKLVGHTKNAHGIDAIPGGKYVVTGSDDGTVRVWRIADGSAVSRFNAGCGEIVALCVLPDGAHVLCTGSDGTLRLWRLNLPKAKP
jgi:WD40 repeat protein